MDYKIIKITIAALLVWLWVRHAGAQQYAEGMDTMQEDYVRNRPYARRDISLKINATKGIIPPLSIPSDVRSKPASTIAEIITSEMWNELFPSRYGVAKTGRNSVTETGGRDFFNYTAFVQACAFFPEFLQQGDITMRKRELAAFLAHVSAETGGLRFSEQLNIAQNYSVDNKKYPPTIGKNYHGRGPMQLSYNYNYGYFSQSFFGDKNILLDRPEILLEDAMVSFASAIWFWMTEQPPKPSCHSVMTGMWQPSDADKKANRLSGFGLTFNIINAKHCGEHASEMAKKRYEIYEYMCYFFKVEKGENCYCHNQMPYGK
jgi:hypothetical protein